MNQGLEDLCPLGQAVLRELVACRVPRFEWFESPTNSFLRAGISRIFSKQVEVFTGEKTFVVSLALSICWIYH